MADMPSTEPLDYAAAPVPAPRRPLVDWSLLRRCVTAAVVVTLVLFYVVPRAQAVFASYNIGLPLATTALFAFSRFCVGGGIVFVWVLFALPPFIAPLLRSPAEPGTPRRRFTLSGLLLMLVFAVFVGWLVLGLLLPYVNMVDSLTSARSK